MEVLGISPSSMEVLNSIDSKPWVIIAPEPEGSPRELVWLNQQMLSEMTGYFLSQSIYVYAPTVYNWAISQQDYNALTIFSREHSIWRLSAGLLVLDTPPLLFKEEGIHHVYVDHYRNNLVKPVFKLRKHSEMYKNFLNVTLALELIK